MRRAVTIAGFMTLLGMLSLLKSPELTAHESNSPGYDKRITAGVPKLTPVIDGKLDDPAWAEAPSFHDFVERKPRLGTVPKNRTVIRVLADAEALYISAECHDLKPLEVRARTMTRDSFSIFSDDAVSVKINPTHDHRTTYGFALNPVGARLDYKAVNESKFMREFDAMWEGAARRTEYGWSAEFKIPLAVFGLSRENLPARMGLNISRDHSRRSATYDWSVMPPPYMPVAAGLYGHLEIPAPSHIQAQKPIARSEKTPHDLSAEGYRFAPYVLSGFQQERPESASALDDPAKIWSVGLDGSHPLGRHYMSHFTVNTDFAQVDVDDQVVNLSRFGLFLPEKRDFFLRDNEIFAFGLPGRKMPFHSRRIGLHEGTPVPILAGHKLSGRPTQGVRVGFLNVLTEAQGQLPWTGNLVWRGLKEFEFGSNAGIMVTHRQSLVDRKNYNTVLGIDGSWRSAQFPLVFDAFGLVSHSGDELGGSTAEVESAGGSTNPSGQDSPEGLQPGVALELMWRGALIRPRMGYSFFAEDFRADLGFFDRVGVHEAHTGIAVEPRIERYSIEKVTLDCWGVIFAAPDGDEILDWNAGGFAGLSWDQGFNTSAYAMHKREDTREAFEVGSATIPVGYYEMNRYGAYMSTPYTFWVGGSANLDAGDYYGGRLVKLVPSFFLKPSPHFRLEAGGQWSRANFDDERGTVDTWVLNTRAVVGFTPALGLDYYVGWDHQAELLLNQGRLRWEFAPDSTLFLVYQENLDDEISRSDFRSVQLKATFGWPGGARR